MGPGLRRGDTVVGAAPRLSVRTADL